MFHQLESLDFVSRLLYFAAEMFLDFQDVFEQLGFEPGLRINESNNSLLFHLFLY
jgi:hypothetical protein